MNGCSVVTISSSLPVKVATTSYSSQPNLGATAPNKAEATMYFLSEPFGWICEYSKSAFKAKACEAGTVQGVVVQAMKYVSLSNKPLPSLTRSEKNAVFDSMSWYSISAIAKADSDDHDQKTGFLPR